MKHIPKFWLTAVSMMLLFAVSSCSKDDKDEPTLLNVSPTQITLLSEKGSSASISITASGEWTLVNNADWLNLSSSSGNGSATVTITSLSMNDSSDNRSTTIEIRSGDNNKTVTIDQLPAYQSDCQIEFDNILTLGQSVAFEIKSGAKVSYFYMGYLEASSAGWTDDRIVETLVSEDRFEPEGADDGSVHGFGGMDSNKTYYLCAIAFDAKGNRGELTKTKITTPKTSQSDPWAYINEVYCDPNYWYCTTTPDGYTSKYYIFALEGTYGMYAFYYMHDAEIAWIIKTAVDSKELAPIVREESWRYSRSADEFFCATWGVGADEKYSPMLNSGLWTIDSENTPAKIREKKSPESVTRFYLSKKERDEILSKAQIRCVTEF